jgi:hypothetical protein
MTDEDAERERAEIRAAAIRRDEGRAWPDLDPATVQLARQLMPGLRAERRQDAA